MESLICFSGVCHWWEWGTWVVPVWAEAKSRWPYCRDHCGPRGWQRPLVLQEGREPDYSEYKEFRLTVENIGYQMLMKMGWKEGEGLGTEGQGIKNPVNK